MKLGFLEGIWVVLTMFLGYSLFTTIKEYKVAQNKFIEYKETISRQEETIKNLQFDFIRLSTLANNNAKAFEMLQGVKNIRNTDLEVKKINIQNLDKVEKDINNVIEIYKYKKSLLPVDTNKSNSKENNKSYKCLTTQGK